MVRRRTPRATLGRGDCFGEIALLHDRPRTATVRASADEALRVSVLQRGPFLTAVTGYPAAASAGEALAASRLGADAERLAARELITARRRGAGAHAQHVRQAAAGDVERPPEAPEPGGIRRRRECARDVLDLDEVRADGADSLELLRDLVHGSGSAPSPVR